MAYDLLLAAGLWTEPRDIAVDVGYTTAIDSRDWPLLRSVFADDCDADYGELGRFHRADELAAWMAAVHDPLGPTMHRITNVVLAPHGDSVRTRCYVHAVVVPDEGADIVHVYALYDDELVRTDGSWRIARRRLTQIGTEQHPPMG